MKKFGIVVLFAAIVAAPAAAQLTWFNSQAAFDAANGGNIFVGVEDYEASVLPPNAVDGFEDTLQFGIPNGPDGFPYPNGTQGLPNLITQSNTDSASGNPNPQGAGTSALAAGSVGFLGFTSDGVVSNTFVNGLDLLYTGGAAGIGGRVIDALGPQTGVLITVYDINNNALGSMTVPGNAGGSNFSGVISGGAAIGRINMQSGGAEGLDDVRAYVVPEPASLGLFLL
ncbi:MAG: hypothetical protein IID33_04905, partial [Planctomycetes bacterium]|nr:hypothetical protein [Planctomycetota bacterium]